MGLGGRIQSRRGLRIGLLVAGALILTAGAVAAARYRAAGSWASPQDESALINFSHQKHAAIGTACQECHGGIEASTKAADDFTPRMKTCYACHDENSTECSFCHKEPGPEYTAFAPAEREVLFNHKLHVEKGLTCDHCHRGVAAVDHAGAAQMPMMADCTTCHDGAQAPANCEICHSNLSDLWPSTHTDEWMHRHQSFTSDDAKDDCAACHGARSAGITDCQECHEGEVLARSGTKSADHFAPYDPNAARRGKPLVLERVHALDYAYTHGQDARGKETDCQSCHEPATFCAECHQGQGGIPQARPLWHGGADWGAVSGGVGTGGGRHGEMARRDIENCAACHDVQGQDPVCLSCHMDRQPGVGNDPRTHESGFMRDVKGPWHYDLNETCFACHQPSPFSAPGFCTYCHGPQEQGKEGR